MGYLGRRIGLSQDQGDSNPGGDNGAVGGGILNLFENGYFERQGDIYNAPGVPPLPEGLTATGGVISDYGTPPGDIYRAHIFTASGDFNVSALGDYGDTIDALLVGGGGGGGNYGGGGGGGAVVHVENKPIATGPNTILIAAGGLGAGPSSGSQSVPASRDGGTTTFLGYTATGGGGAGGYDNQPARGGANGGGHGAYLGPPGTPQGVAGTSPTQPSPLSPYSTVYAGNRGGTHGTSTSPWGHYPSGGGAGAGADGESRPVATYGGTPGGAGGAGKQINIIPSPPSARVMVITGQVVAVDQF